MGERFLIRHLGNLGDLVFLAPPILASLKKHYPNCEITFITSWGFKQKQWRWHDGRLKFELTWGKRDQGGAGIALMMTNPHIDQLVHWHDTQVALDGHICQEEGHSFPTWSAAYYQEQKVSGNYTGVFEIDTGLSPTANPLTYLYKLIGLPDETYSFYQLYLTEQDRAVAAKVMASKGRPRIVLLEGLTGATTRGWDPGKINQLNQAVEERYGVAPYWFGAEYVPYFEGRPLTLRENIALLTQADVGIGVMSGPLHFAAAVGLPTITLYGEQPLDRAAPAYFLNPYITDPKKWHRTLLAPSSSAYDFLKPEQPSPVLTPQERENQKFRSWQQPGTQTRKSCLAVLTVEEIMTVLADSLI